MVYIDFKNFGKIGKKIGVFLPKNGVFLRFSGLGSLYRDFGGKFGTSFSKKPICFANFPQILKINVNHLITKFGQILGHFEHI